MWQGPLERWIYEPFHFGGQWEGFDDFFLGVEFLEPWIRENCLDGELNVACSLLVLSSLFLET